MKNYCFKVKKRGFNYYTDYMERYFECVASQYGYHLTKRQAQGERWCVAFVKEPSAEGSNAITFVPDTFSEGDEEQLHILSRRIGECFKSKSALERADSELLGLACMAKKANEGEMKFSMTEDAVQKYGVPSIWYFSRTHSAFDEPVLSTDAATCFKVQQYSMHLVSHKSFLMGVLNVGGGSKGLAIDISFGKAGKMEIEAPTLIVPSSKNGSKSRRIALDMVRSETEGKIRFHTALPEFEIRDGFNEYSAKLSGKKKHDVAESCSLYVLFTPCGEEAVLRCMEIEIVPTEYPMNRAVFSLAVG